MTTKLISRLSPFLGWKEIIAASKFGMPAVKSFEVRFAKKFGCKHGIMFSHGRTGLRALLEVWGLNDVEVICPAYTCVVVPHAIVLSGNKPVFVDSATDSFNMAYAEIESAFSPKTRAIIVTHLFGRPMNVLRIQEMVRAAEIKYGHKIFVVQDVAHSYGAYYSDELVTSQGDAALFGCNISKIITSVFGGMVTTQDSDTARLLREYCQNKLRHNSLKPISRLFYLVAATFAFRPYFYSLVHFLQHLGWLDRYTMYYDDEKIDFPADWDQKPCDLEARVGLVQLIKYEEIIERRRKNAISWIEHLKTEDVEFFDIDEGQTFSHCVGIVQDRKVWIEKYRAKGIELGILIEYCIPEMKAYATFTNQKYPRSSHYSKHTINFPLSISADHLKDSR